MSESLVVGSQEHQELFCRFFIDTHVAFDPATIDWPVLDEDSFKRLHSLPVWTEAIATERQATCTIQTWAPLETEPLIRQAVALQGYEEARHAAIIQGLITRYEISLPALPSPQPPVDPEWAFLRLGYSECFDAFFTFALFAIARDSGFFPAVLVDKFELVMQEEARHILFFVNHKAVVSYIPPNPCLPNQKPEIDGAAKLLDEFDHFIKHKTFVELWYYNIGSMSLPIRANNSCFYTRKGIVLSKD